MHKNLHPLPDPAFLHTHTHTHTHTGWCKGKIPACDLRWTWPGVGAGHRGSKSPVSCLQYHGDLGVKAAQSVSFQPLPSSVPFLPCSSLLSPPPHCLQPCNSSQLCVHALCDHVSLQHYFCILMLKQYFTHYMTALGAFAEAFHICYFI